jgi:HAD superfamily hydrolase (TIGR01549 family)
MTASLTESKYTCPHSGNIYEPFAPKCAVLFDMDGVLLETRAGWLALMNQLAAECGCAPITADALAKSWGQPVEKDAVEFYGGAELAWVEHAMMQYIDLLLSPIETCPGALEIITSLDIAGIPWAVVTNTPRALAVPMLDRVLLARAPVVCAGSAGAAKPSPELLLAGCIQLGVPPWKCWMVGDTECDAIAAARAGIRFLGIGHSLEGCRTFSGLEQVRSFLDARSWQPDS